MANESRIANEPSDKSEGRGLTPRMMILLPIYTAVSIIIGLWSCMFGSWWVYNGWFPIAPFVLLLILNLLGKVHPSLRLNPHEIVLLLTAGLIWGGPWYFMVGQPYVMSVIPWYGQFSPIQALNNEPWKSAISHFLPSYFAPTDPGALQAIQYGGAFNLSAWMPSFLFWAVWSLTWLLFSYFWTYLLWKPLIVTEKMPFPNAQPTIVTMDYLTGDNPKLFNLKLTSTRVFLITFIIGVIAVLPSILRFLQPGAVPYQELRLFTLDLTPYTMNILPGAATYLMFDMVQFAVGMFVPLDALATIMLIYVVFYIIYPVVGVNTGILPYSPGVEKNSQYYAQNAGIFKFGNMVVWGFTLGIAIRYLYNYRSYIIDIFKATFGDKNVQQQEQGLSHRLVGTGIIVTTLLFIGILLSVGVPVGVALTMTVLYIFIQFAYIAIASILFVGETASSSTNYLAPLYNSGVVTAGWSPSPPNASLGTFMTFYMSTSIGNIALVPGGGTMPQNVFSAYKLADQVKTRFKDIFYGVLIVAVTIAVVSTLTFVPITISYGGLSKTGNIGFFVLPNLYGYWYANTGTAVPNVTEFAGYTISGAIVSILMFMARARFTWFFLNPIAFFLCADGNITVHFLSYAVAFVIKLVILKIGGTRLFEGLGVSGVVGYLMGYGTGAFVMNLIYFGNTIVPTMLARM